MKQAAMPSSVAAQCAATLFPESLRRGARALACGLGIATLSLGFSANAAAAPESFADLAEELLPTVVNISTTQTIDPNDPSQQFEELFREFFERRGENGPDPQQRQRRAPSSLGSGFVIDSSGYIVTNNHVIADADEVTVRFHDDRTKVAEVIGRDDKTDLALLKVEVDDPLPAANWGDSEAARIGDWIIAIGNPFGLGSTVTSGIVSARSRDIQAGPYDDFIQTDASINRGNSGGPMFNIEGEVIGVNTAIFSPSGGSIGIGFAIPSAIAENVVSQLREHGEVRRGWLGVRIQSVTDELAEGLRLDEARGALVASVSEGGPADEGGIRQGDVVLSFDGRPINEMRQLPRIVADTEIGRVVDVVVWRRGEEVTVEVELGRLEDEPEMTAVPLPEDEGQGEDSDVMPLGLSLSALSDELRDEYGLDDRASGVLVTEVDPNGTAAERGVMPGDVIVEVDQQEVANPEEVAEKVDQASADGFRVVTLLIYRDGDYQWVAVRLGG